MHLYTKKSNADRGALRLAAKTGDAYKVERASDGRFFVAIVEPAKPEAIAVPANLPTPPDFTANTHKPYRAKLAKLVALAEAGDVDGLAAIAINPTSTSPKALLRYRTRAIAAIQAAG